MKKPKLSFWEIWNMSFGFLGIQFGFGLQNANVSRIFQTLGAEIDDIAILWLAAPLTGLIIQPIIGYYSDKTWGKLGRRRPYFLIGAILASIALFLMPNSPTLWMAAGMLWIMDASINISMEPFRAFVGDNLPKEQSTMGFAMQSFFIGIGAVVASTLPWMFTNWFNISNVAPDGVIPDSVKWSFYIGAAVFFLAVLWTVIKSKEYSPEELAAFEAAEEKELYDRSELSADEIAAHAKQKTQGGIVSTILGAALAILFYTQSLDKELYVFAGIFILLGLILIAAGVMQKNNSTNNLVTMADDFQFMPKTMKQLAVVQFFSWFALFAMWIYTTSAVTAHIYGETNTTSELYNEGANWVGILFGVYSGVAALVAFLLPVLAKRTSRTVTHMICLVLGGLGLISIYFVPTPNLLILPMIGIGIAWASIVSMPYAILTGALPASKMGYYMGVFNFFIVIPQLVAASILGYLVGSIFEGEAIYALIIGGISMILGGILTLRVTDEN